MGTIAVRIKKKGKRKEERGKTHMSLSLKINEKIGNPRVTAWEKRKINTSLNSPGPSRILETNKSCEICCQYHTSF